MGSKYAKLEEETRVKLNKAKAKYLNENPKTRIASDNKVIGVALSKYLENEDVKN